jgi:hypothetical protein
MSARRHTLLRGREHQPKGCGRGVDVDGGVAKEVLRLVSDLARKLCFCGHPVIAVHVSHGR